MKQPHECCSDSGESSGCQPIAPTPVQSLPPASLAGWGGGEHVHRNPHLFYQRLFDLKVEKRIRLTGVFTQRELGLLNNGELSPSFQFSFPKLTSSRSALISSVERACIMGEQGSDLLRTLIHQMSHQLYLGPLCLPVLRLISSSGEGCETSSATIGSSPDTGGGEGEVGESWEQPNDSSVLSHEGT